MEDVIKDFKIKNLTNDYHKYSLYLSAFQTHIENCYTKYIINIKERNLYLKNINDVIRLLNSKYNDTIVEIYDNDSDELYQNIKIKTNESNIVGLNQLVHVHNMIGITNITNPYDKINNLILKLGSTIGFPSIQIALSIIIDFEYKYLFDMETNNLLEFYDEIFSILTYDIITDKNITKQISITEAETDNMILIQNYANMYIKYKDSYIMFTGYIKHDPLNIIIRTSQLCNNIIYKKKKDLEMTIYNIDYIDEIFVKSYIKNISLFDIIIFDNDKIIEKIKNDYETYNKLTKMSFINLMKEFIKDDLNPYISLKNMFNIIKLLLIGSEESVNIAGILYNVIKKKKSATDYPVSDIIYNNLSYLSQTKLKKSVINIKTEFDKISSIAVDDIDLKKQVLICKNMPEAAKKAAFEKIDEMKSSNNEYYKQLLYVKTLLNFPWPSQEDDQYFMNIGKSKKKSKDFLDNIISKLDSKVYGHAECKESIKELLGKWICNPSSSGSAIGLMGPPGVGKTLIAKAIGESLDIPFVQITLGGQNDGDLLHGHSYTYSGSQPGMIVKKMVEAGNARCIIYFDELDKACKKYDSNEIYNILIHITDPNTNTEFQDRFFQEIKFPLNKVLFIFSYNDSSLIDPILMDRIKNIEVKPFKTSDKQIIINKFIIKEMCKMVNFDENSINLNDKAMEFIINRYTNEPGVRDLKRKFEKIFLRLNLARIYNKKTITKNKPLTLTVELIEEYLGKNNIHIQNIHHEDLVGVINGLYATDSGQGGILPVEVFENYTNNDGKFILKMTGSQRRVMKESVISAFTAAIHCIDEKIRTEYLQKNRGGLHIHTPASSATPKDGPSGGCAFTVAFISRMLNKPIRRDIAITGEIELTGKVAKIGGLSYKLTGAKRSGVKLVFVPEENKDDIEEIKKDNIDLIDQDFNVILVTNVKEILPHVLIGYNKDQLIK